MAAPTDIPAEFLPLVLDFLFDGSDVSVMAVMTQERNLIDIRYHRFDTNIFLTQLIHDINVKLSISTYVFPLNDAILNLTNPLLEAV